MGNAGQVYRFALKFTTPSFTGKAEKITLTMALATYYAGGTKTQKYGIVEGGTLVNTYGAANADTTGSTVGSFTLTYTSSSSTYVNKTIDIPASTFPGGTIKSNTVYTIYFFPGTALSSTWSLYRLRGSAYASGTVTYNNYVLPTVTASGNTTAVEGDNASFSVYATGGVPDSYTYTWLASTNSGGSWSDVPGATGATLTLTAVTQAMNGYWYVGIVHHAAGDVYTGAMTLTVTPAGRVRIRVGGVWKTGTVYIRIGGVWKQGALYINHGGTWKPGQ